MKKEDRIDFGEDADVVAESDPRFDAWIARQAPALNAPNATPHDAMWSAIQAARKTAEDAQAGVIPGVTPLRRNWKLLSLIAAALLVGVAIDRLALRGAGTPAASERVASNASPSAASGPASPGTAGATRLYRLAAAQTLTQAEALLIAYRASDVPARDPESARQLGTWGRQVLSSTRLLLDSPAGDDPQLRPLLDDLELVLVQIIGLSGAPLDTAERALIDRALKDRNLLPRIRSAVPVPTVTSAESN